MMSTPQSLPISIRLALLSAAIGVLEVAHQQAVLRSFRGARLKTPILVWNHQLPGSQVFVEFFEIGCKIAGCGNVHRSGIPFHTNAAFVCKNHSRKAQVETVGREYDPEKDLADKHVRFSKEIWSNKNPLEGSGAYKRHKTEIDLIDEMYCLHPTVLSSREQTLHSCIALNLLRRLKPFVAALGHEPDDAFEQSILRTLWSSYETTPAPEKEEHKPAFANSFVDERSDWLTKRSRDKARFRRNVLRLDPAIKNALEWCSRNRPAWLPAFRGTPSLLHANSVSGHRWSQVSERELRKTLIFDLGADLATPQTEISFDSQVFGVIDDFGKAEDFDEQTRERAINGYFTRTIDTLEHPERDRIIQLKNSKGKMVRACINTSNPNFKEAALIREQRLGNKTWEEVADQLGDTPGAIKMTFDRISKEVINRAVRNPSEEFSNALLSNEMAYELFRDEGGIFLLVRSEGQASQIFCMPIPQFNFELTPASLTDAAIHEVNSVYRHLVYERAKKSGRKAEESAKNAKEKRARYREAFLRRVDDFKAAEWFVFPRPRLARAFELKALTEGLEQAAHEKTELAVSPEQEAA